MTETSIELKKKKSKFLGSNPDSECTLGLEPRNPHFFKVPRVVLMLIQGLGSHSYEGKWGHQAIA